MIQVKETLNVSKESFFNVLANSICGEYKHSTNKELKVENIEKGLKYTTTLTTQLNKLQKVEILVLEYIFGEIYRYQVNNSLESYLVEYNVKEINSEQVEVEYLRGYETEFKSRKYNQRIMEFLFQGKAKKSARIKLRAMERFIISNR